jgi:DNA polymerase/3'-5' exonuclease PolX
MDNPTIADELLKQARTAADECENLYRVRALRRAALVVQSLDRPVATILAHNGLQALLEQPGIGSHLAKRIAELALRN